MKRSSSESITLDSTSFWDCSSKLFLSVTKKYPLPPAAPCNLTMHNPSISFLDNTCLGVDNEDSSIKRCFNNLSASHLKIHLFPKIGILTFSRLSTGIEDTNVP